MQKILRVAALALGLLAGGALAQSVAPVVPVLKSVEQMPTRAKLAAASGSRPSRTAADTSGGLGASPMPFDDVTSVVTVFVLQRVGDMAGVWSPDGRFGFVDWERLHDVVKPSEGDFQAVASVFKKPSLAEKLNPPRRQWLQATLAAALLGGYYEYFSDTDEGARVSDVGAGTRAWSDQRDDAYKRRMARLDLGLVATLRLWKFESLYPVLIQRWWNRASSGVANDGSVVPVSRSYLASKVFPELNSVLDSPVALGSALCRQFGALAQNGSYELAAYSSIPSGNTLVLLLIRTLYPQHPPACLLKWIEQVAAYGSDRETWHALPPDTDTHLALDMLQGYLGLSAFEQWVISLRKAKPAPSPFNLALTLTVAPAINHPPLIEWLYARLGRGDLNEEQSLVMRQSLRALAARGESARFRAALMKIVTSRGLDSTVRVDAVSMLGAQTPSLEVADALAKVLIPPRGEHDDVRLTQVAAEVLADERWRALAATAWWKALDHADPYVRHLALGVSRDEALAAIKAAPSKEVRDLARGTYLDAVRARVEALRLDGIGLDVRPSPRWMVKPSATVAVRLRQVWNPERFVPRLVFEAPPSAEIVRWERDQPPSTERQPVVVEPLMLLPGRVVLHTTGSAAQTQLTVQVALDELGADGRPLVDAARPGIYTLTMYEGDTVLFRTAWYNEPDNAFWRDSGADAAEASAN